MGHIFSIPVVEIWILKKDQDAWQNSLQMYKGAIHKYTEQMLML